MVDHYKISATGAESLIEKGNYREALESLHINLEADPDDWYLNYLAGQCERFCGNIDKAIGHLEKADRYRGSDDSSVLLALAIAYQKMGRYDEVKDVLRRSLDANPDHIPSLNTLAMTQKLAGEPEKAAVNYDNALKIIARGLAKEMVNNQDAQIYKYQPWEDRYSAWIEYAMDAAITLGVRDNVDAVAWPSGEVAIREETTEQHGGLYWTDQKDKDGRNVRLFWPNFFTTFRERMTGHPMYAHLIGNRSTVLMTLGDNEKADQLLAEAGFFHNLRNRRSSPIIP